MSLSFVISLARSLYLLIFSLFFISTPWSVTKGKCTRWQVLLFLLINIRSDFLARIWWSVHISMSQRISCILFSRTDSGLYYLSVWSNFNLLHKSQLINLPTQSCLYLYKYCAKLLHSLIMWLTVSSLSPHNISLPTHEYDRGRQEKIERQTNKQSLGLPRAEKRYCNTTYMCGLSLAWVTSENSTMLLESDILRLFFTGPYLVSSPLCSGVWCWLPLRGLQPQLPSAPVQLPTVSLWVASSTLIRLPVPLPGTARFHVQESFVWFRAKTDNWIVCFGSLPP